MARSFAAHTFALAALLACANAGTFLDLVARAPKSCPADAPVSCQNTGTFSDSCCLNTPGGQLLQTQFWDTNPPTGPDNSWTLHGLWPDKCDGTFDASCDASREYSNITDILTAAGATDTLNFMQTYWKDYQGQDEQFWSHEWDKHGTCISTLDPTCYDNYQPTQEVVDFFNTAVALFKTLPSYDWLIEAGITPSDSQTYTSADIQAALKAKHGNEVTLGCKNGVLDQIWYHYNVKGSVVTGQFISAAPDGTKSTCPASGIQYLPKGSGGNSGGSGTTTSSAAGSSPTGTIFNGKGQLKVVNSQTGAPQGCLISSGTWYTTGTCATFTATASGDGFTLASSKGDCGIVNGDVKCGSGVSLTTFTAVGSNLVVNGSSKFYADAEPQGSTQQIIHSDSGAVEIAIIWA